MPPGGPSLPPGSADMLRVFTALGQKTQRTLEEVSTLWFPDPRWEWDALVTRQLVILPLASNEAHGLGKPSQTWKSPILGNVLFYRDWT